MKKNLSISLVAAAALLSFATSSPAAPYHLTTVSSVIASRGNLDADDRYVSLIGHVTYKIDDETYWFTDGTGSVRLDSEDYELPIGPQLVVGGRIDQAYLGIGHLEVDVRRWHYAYK